jgi:hypothetical protein
VLLLRGTPSLVGYGSHDVELALVGFVLHDRMALHFRGQSKSEAEDQDVEKEFPG